MINGWGGREEGGNEKGGKKVHSRVFISRKKKKAASQREGSARRRKERRSLRKENHVYSNCPPLALDKKREKGNLEKNSMLHIGRGWWRGGEKFELSQLEEQGAYGQRRMTAALFIL